MIKKEYREKMIPQLVVKSNFYRDIPSFEEGFNFVIQKWEYKQEKNQKKDKMMRSFD